jgi:hypothetical protein
VTKRTAIDGTSPQAELRGLLASYWKPHAVAAAARLGLADAMMDGAHDAWVLAARIRADGDHLHRLLRALAAIGLVEDHGDGTFSLTATGQRLRAGHPESLKGMALHVGTQLSPAFASLHECVTTGQPPADIKHGPEGFAELNDDHAAAAVFNQSMVDNSRRFATEAAQACDFSRFATIMDVGGGYGAVLATLLRSAPETQGMVLDLPHAREGAERLLAAEGVAERARFVEASFFEPFPVQADAYVLKYILHDWDDAHAARIVERLGEAARASEGTVFIIEKVLPERIEARPDHAIAVQGDLTMMLWNGRERTHDQFAALLAHGDLTLTGSTALSDNHYLLEARPTR